MRDEEKKDPRGKADARAQARLDENPQMGADRGPVVSGRHADAISRGSDEPDVVVDFKKPPVRPREVQ